MKKTKFTPKSNYRTMIDYDTAKFKIAFLEDNVTLDNKRLTLFDKAMILAHLFDKPKEQTADDIIILRARALEKSKKVI